MKTAVLGGSRVSGASLALMAGLALASSLGSGVSSSAMNSSVAEASKSANRQPIDRSNDSPRDTKTNRLRSNWAPTKRGGRRAGYGWTNAHAQRVAKKARSVKRHRKANRA